MSLGSQKCPLPMLIGLCIDKYACFSFFFTRSKGLPKYTVNWNGSQLNLSTKEGYKSDKATRYKQ